MTMRAKPPHIRAERSGFTLIEMLLAIMAAAILFVALYGLFARTIKLRDSSQAHMKEARIRAHALALIKNDLTNARIVSSAMRGGLVVTDTNPYSTPFPGYLRFTSTTGRDTLDSQYGDSQEIEYYIDSDAQSANTQAGVLVRTVDRVLLADTPQITTEERLLTNIASMEIELYDGTDWQTSWDSSTASSASTGTTTPTTSTSSSSSSSSSAATLIDPPKAVRIRLIPYAAQGEHVAPIEVFVPWSTQKQP